MGRYIRAWSGMGRAHHPHERRGQSRQLYMKEGPLVASGARKSDHGRGLAQYSLSWAANWPLGYSQKFNMLSCLAFAFSFLSWCYLFGVLLLRTLLAYLAYLDVELPMTALCAGARSLDP